jgi:hypothetical protein
MAVTKIMVIRHAEKPDPYNGQAYSGVDASGTPAPLGVPASWPTGPNGARDDLVWVFDRPSGTGPITGFAQIAQMLLPGDAAAPST